MFFTQSGLKIGGGEMLWVRLMLAPFHEETVGQASKHSDHEHGLGVLDPTAIVVIGNIEPLMEPAFDSPPMAVELEPELGWQFLDRRAGDQSHFLILAPLGLTQEPSHLRRKRKPHIF